MDYNSALLSNEGLEAAKGDIYLGWLNPNGGGAGIPLWQNAIAGNFPPSTPSPANFFLSSWASAGSPLVLGDWGVDTSAHTAWAVLNHNSQFAVVPEPSTLLLAALGLFGIGVARGRRR